MKFYWCISLFSTVILSSCQGPAPQDAVTTGYVIPAREVETELITLLTTWYPRIVDEENGGYWTNFEYDWSRSTEQTKMLVTQARGLWTAARAAGLYPENQVYRKAADHGFRFLVDQMWDKESGGFYQYYPPRTPDAPAITHKLVYGNAFALYGIAEYAKINPAPEITSWLRKVFSWMEAEAHDAKYLGYHTLIIPDSIRNSADPQIQSEVEKIGWGGPDSKDQNSSIHILEALTTVYQVLPEEQVRARLEEMLRLVRDTMVGPGGSLFLYFQRNWTPVDHRDSSRQFVVDNQRYDHRSFGHDIETAYLLAAASEALYGRVDPRTLDVGKQLLNHTLTYGFDENYYGIYDRGYHFSGQSQIEILNRQKTWWAEAEAWHALVLFSRYFPDEARYSEAATAMWNYIKKELIDPKYGGWYSLGIDENPEIKEKRKASPWKGAYHNGRALIRVLEYSRNPISK